jgi:YD repeat-containing protein
MRSAAWKPKRTRLGTFTYSYDGLTSRIAAVVYPNGQTSAYTYFGNMVDRRLQTIHHRYPNGGTLSRFDYAYDAVGNILIWGQQTDVDAVLWEYGYDATDQLVAARRRRSIRSSPCSAGMGMRTTQRATARSSRSAIG